MIFLKTKAAFLYQARYQLISLGIFFGFYLLFVVVFPLLGLIFADAGNTYVAFDTVGSICTYAGIMSFITVKKDFRFFIQNGMSRNNIFLISTGSNLFFALVLALISRLTIRTIGFSSGAHFVYNNFILQTYHPSNWLVSLILVLAPILYVFSLGMLAGTFVNRVRGMLRMIILAILVLLPVSLLVLFQFLEPTVQNKLIHFFLGILGLSTAIPNTGAILGTFFVFIVFNLGISYLWMRRQEIVRIDA